MGPEASCPQCGVANPAVALFCMGCGASLARTCPACGAGAPASARFCIACGATFDDTADATEEPLGSTEQRRTVTILFADLSGFTAVAERLDHETVKVLIERCLTRFASEVESFGGHIDKYIGDNVMAVFGAPVAHEDDPERAVRSACRPRWSISTSACAPITVSSSRCAWASTRARCWPARSATDTR
jgi:adenylate cyclase